MYGCMCMYYEPIHVCLYNPLYAYMYMYIYSVTCTCICHYQYLLLFHAFFSQLYSQHKSRALCIHQLMVTALGSQSPTASPHQQLLTGGETYMYM